MSDSERKSQIPDEQLADLAAVKLRELETERAELSDQLFQAMSQGTLDEDGREKLQRQIENHDEAADKLTMYRADMLDSDDWDNN